MKVAICISGETRTWNTYGVTRGHYATSSFQSIDDKGHNYFKKVTCCESFYEMYNSITDAYPDVQFDIYGVTWDHCELPLNIKKFKNVNIVNWHDTDFRLLETYKEIYYQYSRFGTLPDDTRDLAYLNTMAQWWGMIQCFKDATTTDDYDLYVRARWDLNYDVLPATDRIQSNSDAFTNLHTPKTIFGSAVSIEYGGKYDVVKFHDQFFILSKDIIDALDLKNNTAATSLVNTFGLNRWPPLHLYRNQSAVILDHYNPNLNYTALTVFNKEWFSRTITDDIDTAKFFSMEDIKKAQQLNRPK